MNRIGLVDRRPGIGLALLVVAAVLGLALVSCGKSSSPGTKKTAPAEGPLLARSPSPSAMPEPMPVPAAVPVPVAVVDMAPVAPNAMIPDPDPAMASPPKGGTQAPRKAGPRRLGAADYKRQIAALTDISVTTGNDRMKSVAIAVKCRTAEECSRLVSGRDVLRSGTSSGDLDSARPSAGAGGRTGHAVRGIPRTAMGGAGASKIRSRVIAQVPPIRGAGAAANRVRAKIRARVYGFKACHARALQRAPMLTGIAKVSFTLQVNGRVTGVSVAVTGLSADVHHCIRAKVGRWHLGKVPKEIRIGPISVRFRPAT